MGHAIADGLPLTADVRTPEGAALALFYADRFEILLDGQLLSHVVAYDGESGEVVKYRLDVNGNPYGSLLEAAAELETVKGDLVVRWKE